MSDIKLAVFGGFLGAGKTSCILDVAKRLVTQGKKIGIVTNDQGSNLVDTAFLASEGLSVIEVAGGCFCCNFDEFIQKMRNMSDNEAPDIILAEPVGSCTDLIANVFNPLNKNYSGQFKLSPLCVVVDPKRVQKLIIERGESLFPSEINYLFKKQLEEADIILLNKTDTLTDQQMHSMVDFLKENFKEASVISVSAKNGQGMDKLLPVVFETGASLKKCLDIDYNTYGAAEGYLGWFNSNISLKSQTPVDFNAWIVDFMNRVRMSLTVEKCEIAHLKVYSVFNDDFAKASITSLDDEINFMKKMQSEAREASVIVNARIAVQPIKLSRIIEQTLQDTCKSWGIALEEHAVECFSPSKPKPQMIYHLSHNRL
jgi:Ni2+-binding GTPase involved in maturation of urease and hydrogenase